MFDGKTHQLIDQSIYKQQGYNILIHKYDGRQRQNLGRGQNARQRMMQNRANNLLSSIPEESSIKEMDVMTSSILSNNENKDEKMALMGSLQKSI